MERTLTNLFFLISGVLYGQTRVDVQLAYLEVEGCSYSMSGQYYTFHDSLNFKGELDFELSKVEIFEFPMKMNGWYEVIHQWTFSSYVPTRPDFDRFLVDIIIESTCCDEVIQPIKQETAKMNQHNLFLRFVRIKL